MYTKAIIQHLDSMCEGDADIKVISADEIQEGAIFVSFAFGKYAEPQTAIYYPDDDILFTPSDWQSGRPTCADEIEDYEWIDSAGDWAIVVNGLPRLFTPIRDAARKEYGRKVAAARNDKGLSQPDLARLSGINQANISRIESGRYSVTLDTMTRLSAVLGDI